MADFRAGFARSRSQPPAMMRSVVKAARRTAQGMYQARFVVALADDNLNLVAGRSQRVDRLLMGGAEQRGTVYFQDSHSDLSKKI